MTTEIDSRNVQGKATVNFLLGEDGEARVEVVMPDGDIFFLIPKDREEALHMWRHTFSYKEIPSID